MTYAKVLNGTVVGVVSDLPEVVGNISGFRNADAATQRAHGFFPLVGDPPTHDPLYERVIGPVYSIGADVVTATYSAEGRPLDDIKTDLKAKVSALRWAKETGGVAAGGQVIRSDEVSQAKLNGAVTLINSDPSLTSIDWEAQPGVWVTASREEILALGIAVGRHVQSCFSRARALHEMIAAAASKEELQAIDIEAGWPK